MLLKNIELKFLEILLQRIKYYQIITQDYQICRLSKDYQAVTKDYLSDICNINISRFFSLETIQRKSADGDRNYHKLLLIN